MNHLGIPVPEGDMPTWLQEEAVEIVPGRTALQFLVCDRDPEVGSPWELDPNGPQYYDEGWLNGVKVVNWGDIVLLKDYLRNLNRFRIVGHIARVRSGGWDDKIEHLVVDLYETPAKNKPHRVYVIKASDVILASQHYEKDPGEPSLLRSALDSFMEGETRTWGMRPNRGCVNAYPPKGLSPPSKKTGVDSGKDLAAPRKLDFPANGSFSESSNPKNDNDGNSYISDLSDDESRDSNKKKRKNSSRKSTVGAKKKKKSETGKRARDTSSSSASPPAKKLRLPEIAAVVTGILDAGWSVPYKSWKQVYNDLVGEEICTFQDFKTIK